MDSDQYVPITTISSFNAVKKLTKDINLIVAVLRGKVHNPDSAMQTVSKNIQFYFVCYKKKYNLTDIIEKEIVLVFKSFSIVRSYK